METKLAIILSLPKVYGGYGLDGLCLNHRVDPSRLRKLSQQAFFSIDLAYPKAKVGIEFDGQAFHENYSKDRVRINALEALGWDIISVDKSQLFNVNRFDVTAHQIAKLLGKQIRKPNDWDKKAETLRHDLGLA